LFEVIARFHGEIAQGEGDPNRLFRRWWSGDGEWNRQRNQYDRAKDLLLHGARLAKIAFEKQA
jgi:hypothetical protein